MSNLSFKSDHNKTAYLTKTKSHEEFDPMVDFLLRSKLHFALTVYPDLISVSLVKQFWNTAKVVNTEGNPTKIVGKVDRGYV